MDKKWTENLLPVHSRNEIRAYQTSPDFHRRLFNDLNVGPNKPMGYLPKYTVKVLLKEDLHLLKRQFRSKGIKFRFFSKKRARIWSGAVYVYDHDAVAQIVEKYRVQLKEHNWPTKPDRIVARIASHWLSMSHPLHQFIKDLFGDHYRD